MSLALSSLHSEEESIMIGPAAPHRCPLVRTVLEGAVQREVDPPRTADGRIVPEHAPWLSDIGLIALVESIMGAFVLGTVEHHGIGGGGKFVGSVVAIVEKGGGSPNVHVVVSGILDRGVLVQQAVVGASRGQESGGHLGVTGGTKVPVVGGLGPTTVGGNPVDAGVQGVADGLAKEVFGGSSGIVAKDSKSAKGETTIANAIPITRGVTARPPAINRVGSIEDGLAGSHAVLDHGIPHLLLFIVGQGVV